jgi:hypothetical protein
MRYFGNRQDFFLVVIGGIAVKAVLTLTEAIAGRLVGAIVLLGRAMLLNPAGIFITAVVAAGVAIFELSDKIKKVFGVDVKKDMEDFVNIIAKGFEIALVVAKGLLEGFHRRWRDVRHHRTHCGAVLVGSGRRYRQPRRQAKRSSTTWICRQWSPRAEAFEKGYD